MFEHKHMKRFCISLLAAMLALTLLPFSALAVTENVLETAPEVTPTVMVTAAVQATEEVPAAEEAPAAEESLPAEEPQATEDVPAEEAAPAEESSTQNVEEYSPYMPYEQYFPERGTTPEAEQYKLPRMSDGELARYKELFSELSDGSRSLEGVPTCVNRKDMDNTTVGVYPLDPKDFDGETFYVILPYEQKMDDGQILSLIASFIDLGISFDPDSLNERNCTRMAYSGGTRFLSREEESRKATLQALISRGLLTQDSIAPESACFYTDSIPGCDPFCFYPYRSLSDDELAAFLLSDHIAWEMNPDVIRQIAEQEVGAVVPLPDDLSLTDSKVTEKENFWKPVLSGDTVNEYELFLETPPAIDYSLDHVIGELSDVYVFMLGEPGKVPRTEGFCIRYWVSIPADDVTTGDNFEACAAAADQWARTKLKLPEDQLPDSWKINHRDDSTIYLGAETKDWEFVVWLHENNAQVTVCYLWSKAFRDLNYDDYSSTENNSQVVTAAADTADAGISGLVAADDTDTDDIDTFFAASPYLPYEQYFPVRGTTSEESQYKLPRMSDGELARYNELLEQVENGTLSLKDIPTCINRKDMDDTTVGVYPLDPKDFAGETLYVILPYNQNMGDQQILSLIASFRELGISFDPDSLNERNCTRMAYNGVTRYLTQEEESRKATLQDMIARGVLTQDSITPESACFYTDSIPGYTPFCFYPYRSLTDDELAAFLFADHTAWSSDPILVQRIAKLETGRVVPLPNNLTVTDSKMTVETNTWTAFSGDTVNRYDLYFENDAGQNYSNIVTGELADIEVWMLEGDGNAPRTEGFCVRYWVNYPSDEVFTGDNSEACLAAAETWSRTKLTLPEAQRPDNWTINHKDNDNVYLYADTDDWEIILWVHESNAQPAVCYMWAKEFRDYDYSRLSSAESSEESDSYLPYDQQPDTRESVSEETADEPLEAHFVDTVSPWLTDTELARVRVLMAALESGEKSYNGPSVVNIPYADKGAAVYTVNPEDFDGETFYVFLPDSTSMNDEELLALLSAFKELGISFDPDSLTSRNCCRHCNKLQTRSLSGDEQTRMDNLRDKILSGEITRQDIAGTSVQVVEKTTRRVWGTDTKLFRFYPYREMTDDELAAFLFTELDGWDADPEAVMENSILSAMDLLKLPTAAMNTKVSKASMDFFSRDVTQYTFEFRTDNQSDVPGGWLAVKHMQETGKAPELSGIHLLYFSMDNQIQSADAIEAAEQWTRDFLMIPVRNAEWVIVDENRDTGDRVQLQLLLDQWDIRLWVTKGTFQPDECYLYTRKWYTLDDADLTEITDWFAKEGYADLTDERVSQLIESHKLANGYFF